MTILSLRLSDKEWADVFEMADRDTFILHDLITNKYYSINLVESLSYSKNPRPVSGEAV